MKLILASTSKYRAAQLNQLAAEFMALAPDFDEDSAKLALVEQGASPQHLAEALAKGKAESLVDGHPNAIILGGDQLGELDGQVLGKPGSEAQAVDQLASMSGRTHRLITSVYLAVTNDRGELVEYRQHTDMTQLSMRALSRSQLEAYVRYDQPIDCAGSYKLESAGIGLFDRIDSKDSSAIQGLPLLTLSQWFSEFSIASKAFGRF